MPAMPVVIPIFFHEDASLWHGTAGQRVLRKVLESIAFANNLGPVLVVSDDMEVLSLGKRLGVETALRPVSADEETSLILPFGSRAALAVCRELPSVDAESVLLMDFRNPLLAPHDLEVAMGEFNAKSTGSFVSIMAMRDNPCQLEAYYDLIDSGIIHWFESDTQLNECLEQCDLHSVYGTDSQSLLVTRPFTFDWAGRGVEDATGSCCYVRVHRTDRLIEYCRLDEALESGFDVTGRFVWVCEGKAIARLIVPETALGDMFDLGDSHGEFQLVGATLEQGKASPTVLVYQGADKQFRAKVSRDRSGFCIGILPVGEAAMDEPIVSRVDRNGEFHFNGPDGVPFVYWILKEIGEDGSCGVTLSFPGEGVLWKTDHGTGQKVNLKTGEVIAGRQNFPEVYSPEGSVAILAVDGYDEFDERVSGGKCYGWILDDQKCLRISSGFDLLRYRSLVESF